MATKQELEQENERLRAELAAAQGGHTSRPVPGPPSFKICAGVAADLEIHGKALDPFTGKTLTVDEPAEAMSSADPLSA